MIGRGVRPARPWMTEPVIPTSRQNMVLNRGSKGKPDS
jgi:hypothetical protein